MSYGRGSVVPVKEVEPVLQMVQHRVNNHACN